MNSEGKPCGSPKYYRKAQQRRTHAQRGLRHKKPGSRNYEKQKRRIAKIERHVANQRRDFLHKRSTAIAKQYDLAAVETLNMRAMANKNFGNGKATLDNGWGMFLSMLEYKMAERGKILVRVDPWFPSSQLCYCCGHQTREVKDLRIRQWDCTACGAHHDRDHNAAINIRQEGIRQYLRSREIA
jgi:putative transposase